MHLEIVVWIGFRQKIGKVASIYISDSQLPGLAAKMTLKPKV